MRRPTEPMSRRDLIKAFGFAGLFLHPVMQSMAYAAETSFKGAPRYIHFFKGGSFYPARTNPTSLANLAGTPIAPLQASTSDLLLFKGMNIHGGSPKTNGYKEEHAAGVIGCATANAYKYYKNDAYFAYTDNESIDVRIANAYKARPNLAHVPIASLHIGGGAHSDADNLGAGVRYISFRKRDPGDKGYWANAIEPMQDSGKVYDLLMRAATSICAKSSNQPHGDTQAVAAATAANKSLVDVKLESFREFQRRVDLGAEHSRKASILIEELRATEKAAAAVKPSAACVEMSRVAADGANKKNLDQLSPVHDQMIQMIKLAFQMDLTRVVAFTLSGASSGQVWPSHGVHTAHHTLEHNGNVDGLVKIDTYYAEKFAGLLSALKSIDDGGGKTALYNSSVFLGMECWSNSSSGHYLTNVPFILAGQGAGHFETGRIVDAGGRNNNDLHLSCLRASGIDDKTFGLESLCRGPIV